MNDTNLTDILDTTGLLGVFQVAKTVDDALGLF